MWQYIAMLYLYLISVCMWQVYKRLSGKTAQECIIEASEFCSRKITHQGIFYEVSVSLISESSFSPAISVTDFCMMYSYHDLK